MKFNRMMNGERHYHSFSLSLSLSSKKYADDLFCFGYFVVRTKANKEIKNMVKGKMKDLFLLCDTNSLSATTSGLCVLTSHTKAH